MRHALKPEATQCRNQTPDRHGPCGICPECLKLAVPTEQQCIDQMFRTLRTLLDVHGWREVIYAPKDRPIEVITIGSTGIFIAHWLKGGGWFVEDARDLWPAKPMCWREVTKADPPGPAPTGA